MWQVRLGPAPAPSSAPAVVPPERGGALSAACDGPGVGLGLGTLVLGIHVPRPGSFPLPAIGIGSRDVHSDILWPGAGLLVRVDLEPLRHPWTAPLRGSVDAFQHESGKVTAAVLDAVGWLARAMGATATGEKSKQESDLWREAFEVMPPAQR